MKSFDQMSDAELLALLVGEEVALKLAERPLSEIFGYRTEIPSLVSESRAIYQDYPILSASKELISRCFVEKMEAGDTMTSQEIVKQFLCNKIGNLEHEVFWCLWLDNCHRLVAFEEMFRGTIDQAVIYPREIVKRALQCNAAAVILAHNHPSGNITPSGNDEGITRKIQKALDVIEVRLLDHIVVGKTRAASFAEMGRL